MQTASPPPTTQLERGLLPVGRMSQLLAGELGVYGHKPQVLNDMLAGERVTHKVAPTCYVFCFCLQRLASLGPA